MAFLDFDAWREDVLRIARGFAGKMKKGHWDTTTADAWGTIAMDRFSRKFEGGSHVGNVIRVPCRETGKDHVGGKLEGRDGNARVAGQEEHSRDRSPG